MLWLLACRPAPVPVTAEGVPSPLVPSVLLVTVDGPAGQAFVEFGLDGVFDRVSPTGAPGDELALLGLKGGRTYEWRAVVVDDAGERHVSEPAEFAVPEAPPGLGTPEVTSSPEAELDWVLVSVIVDTAEYQTSFAAILDRDGDWVWWVNTDGQLLVTPELGDDGSSVLFSTYAFDKVADEGSLVRVSLDGRSRTETRLPLGHHDFVQHDDGTIAFLTTVFDRIEVGGDTIDLMSDGIAVAAEGSQSETLDLRFSMLADFPLSPEPTCSHITSEEPRFGYDSVAEWTHGNSFAYVAETDAWYVNQKFTDWLLKIDRSTGELDWILNGRGSDFAQPGGEPVWSDIDQTTLWSHAHLSEVWADGAMVFDNGDHHDPPVSRAIEVAWDEEARTAEVVWEFPHPGGLQTPALGDVRRLGENVLVTWAGLGEVTEVTRGGEIVWSAAFPSGLVGRLVPVADPSRAP